jgi:hypothetical protein
MGVSAYMNDRRQLNDPEAEKLHSRGMRVPWKLA